MPSKIQAAASWLILAYILIALGAAVWYRLGLGGFQGGLSFVALVAVIAVGLVAAAVRPLKLTSIFVIAGLVAVAWAIFVQPTPFSDFGGFHDLASRFSRDFDLRHVWRGKSAATVLLYGTVFTVFGTSLPVVWVTGILIHLVNSWLVYRIGLRLGTFSQGAGVAAALYCTWPALVGYSPVLNSEGVMVLAALLGTLLLLQWCADPASGFRLMGSFCLFAASFLARGSGLAYILGGLAGVVLFVRRESIAPRRIAWAAAGLLLVLGVQLAMNVAYANNWSVSSNQNGSLLLMFGTNREARGGYNIEDLELIGWVEIETASQRVAALEEARQIGIKRILDDPPGFVWFAATAKMAKMWESQANIVRWSYGGDEERFQAVDRRLVGLLVDGWFVALLLASVIGVSVYIIRPNLAGTVALTLVEFVVVVGPLVLVAGLHAVIEVRQRYQAPFLPILALFGAVGLDAVGSWWQRRRLTV